jgi:hypothetical protein
MAKDIVAFLKMERLTAIGGYLWSKILEPFKTVNMVGKVQKRQQ